MRVFARHTHYYTVVRTACHSTEFRSREGKPIGNSGVSLRISPLIGKGSNVYRKLGWDRGNRLRERTRRQRKERKGKEGGMEVYVERKGKRETSTDGNKEPGWFGSTIYSVGA